MRLSRVLPALLIFTLSSVAIAYKMGFFEPWLKPMIIAAIDRGAVTNADELAKAIRDEVAKGARVINISVGFAAGSGDLEAAIKEAKAKNVVIVVAAGTGVTNAFRPDDLAAIYPQAYDDVIVVGAARSFDDTDMLMNHGDELDVVVLGDFEASTSTRIAAATVSTTVAMKLKVNSTDIVRTLVARAYNLESVRAMLRASSKAPTLNAGPGFSAVLSRLGFGAFDASAFLDASVEPLAARVYHNLDGGAQIELSSVSAIESLQPTLDCADKTMAEKAIVRAEALKKGRGRVIIERSGSEFSLKECVAKITAKCVGVADQRIQLSF